MTEFSKFVDSIRHSIMLNKQRRLIVLQGERTWAIDLITQIEQLGHTVWLGDDGMSEFENRLGEDVQLVAMNKAQSVLGTETSTLVFDSYSGFNPDAFGKATGILKGGGVCFLITPAEGKWLDYNDPDYNRYIASPDQLTRVNNFFIQRLINQINQDQTVIKVRQEQALPVVELHPDEQGLAITEPAENSLQPLTPFANMQQQRSALEIIKTITGHRKRPLIMTADRGRGKTSVLGLAAAQLIRDHAVSHIIVTAPKIDAVASLFKHAVQLLPGAVCSKTDLKWQGKVIEFVAPDVIVTDKPKCDLLLVDEAAAIPTSMLTIIAQSFSRIVFATTIHGYEGTGRGFALRFMNTLVKLSPNYRQVELMQPIRWSENDPVEAFTNRILALNFKSVNYDSSIEGVNETLEFEKISQQQLLDKPQLLEQLFGLLVLAHYQTSPTDFRQLLDAPQLHIFVVKNQENIVATALVLEEGLFEEELAEQVWLGKRRLRGHLLAQSLMAQLGLQQAGQYKFARVMRIAVHPQLQRQRIGQRLNEFVKQWALKQHFDYLGASFGATAPLLDYWHALGYQAVRLGLTKDKASGTHSVMVLQPLSVASELLMKNARGLFVRSLRYNLSGDFNAIEPTLISSLSQNIVEPHLLSPLISHQDHINLTVYGQGQRPFEQINYAFDALFWQQPSQISLLTPAQQQLLVIKLLQQRTWSETTKLCEYNGKKLAQRAMKQLAQVLIDTTKHD
ncbi:tRNA(Met) cytidine acetyltransferase TmcA [Psychrobium sp. 1_MG-2023]|uniref:tRNA(Met) cytidine acetyltransferase TmcA n=1 Tax=Psychrobium sp. 1_MG-2023 TaxID=3062624 RepID=UPI000C31EBEA|nr:GNAT family N-acetyltransferase [Psychrobium sp. 1_MG-2023]MDP2561069.1 GNAT family N-acetyltransferase [Psychrobium sp. 1_MG-2023]PKF58359.1 hypothetical protein CW748_04145 [Alteromonadales bacterium alter-6D02]